MRYYYGISYFGPTEYLVSKSIAEAAAENLVCGGARFFICSTYQMEHRRRELPRGLLKSRPSETLFPTFWGLHAVNFCRHLRWILMKKYIRVSFFFFLGGRRPPTYFLKERLPPPPVPCAAATV